MNDGWFFGVLIYLVSSVLIVGAMPSDFYSGTSYTAQTEDNIRQTIDSGSTADSTIEQLSFMQKILTFLFISWSIDGIPFLIAVIITMLNLFSIIVIVVWIYDKIRGIGS